MRYEPVSIALEFVCCSCGRTKLLVYQCGEENPPTCPKGWRYSGGRPGRRSRHWCEDCSAPTRHVPRNNVTIKYGRCKTEKELAELGYIEEA